MGPGPALLLALLIQAVPARATSFTVTNTSDAGPGSLRQAILTSNHFILPGPNYIRFAIGHGGVQTITLASPLPKIVRPVTIDGRSQPAVHGGLHCSTVLGHPCIEVKGGGLTPASNSVFTVVAGRSRIIALAINGPDYALSGGALVTLTNRGGNVLEGNYLGTDVTGTAATPTAFGNGYVDGIRVQSAGNRIGGLTAAARNVISGNATGIRISGATATNNTVQGNYIGTDHSGTAAVPNVFVGIGIRDGAASNTIGGTVQGARNLISGNSGNSQSGIDLGGGAAGNVVVGNFIGTDATGTHALGNTLGIGIFAPNNRIGGTSAAEANVISGNQGPGSAFGGGIYVYGVSALIQGNSIGTDVTGTAALPNSPTGIFVFDTGAVTIGGTALGAGNVISGNVGTGIHFEDVVDGSLVQGNRIGTQRDGTGALGNSSHGVFLDYYASGVTVGGTTAGARNTIAYNRGAGVAIGPNATPGKGDAILGNAIFANGGLGIDLGIDGVTANDPGDADTGANELQNAPVLVSASSDGASTTIQGTLDSTANMAFRLELFASGACDPSGSGEGQVFLGAATATTDAAGNASFNVTLPVGVAAGQQATATATDAKNNTSEFSGCQPVVAALTGKSG